MNIFLKLFWFLKTLYSPKVTVLNIDALSGIKDILCNNALSMQCILNKMKYLREVPITTVEVTSNFTARKSR